MKVNKKRMGKSLKCVLLVALCLVLTFGSAMTIMASNAGDLNGDGKITAFDAQMLAEYQAGERELRADQVIGLTVRGIIDWILGRTTEDAEPSDEVQVAINVKNENGQVAEAVTVQEGDITVTVPAGVKVSGETLTLTIQQTTSTEGDVELEEGQEELPLDIHVDGISADNTVPVIICIGQALDTGLNKGNLSLYHVENGEAVAMTETETVEGLTAHNMFCYDPATGDVTVAMATFSVVRIVAEPEKIWEGECNVSWYEEGKTSFEIFNADQLAGLGKLVDEGNTFEGKTVTLHMDVKLSDGSHADGTTSFDPIGYGYVYNGGQAFMGTFDGNGNTIYNLYQNGWSLGYSYSTAGGGLFASACDATIKNLTMDNAYIVMECIDMGTVVGYAQGNCTFENIVVRNSTLANYQRYTGGAIGEVSNGHHILKNVDVEASTTVGNLWGDFDNASGGLIGGKWGHNNDTRTGQDGHKVSVYMEKCDSAAKLDVYNDVTSAYQWYSYRRAGMLIGMSEENKTVNGRTEATATYLTTVDCTVQYGDWVNYHYCEFAGTTSLSARYPWVRVEGSNFNGAYSNPRYGVPTFADQTLNVDTHTENDGCHIDGDGHDVCIVFNQLYGGGQGCYGGNSHVDQGVTVIGAIKSAPKFKSKEVENIKTDAIVKLGDLFEAVEGADIQSPYVYAFVSPVNEEDTVRGTTAVPAADKDWKDLTITFSGEGTAKIVISDYYYCEETVLYVTVGTAAEPVVKFNNLFTGNFLYRVGNQNTVALSSLFEAVNDTVEIGNVTATVTNVSGNAAGTYTANETWTSGTIQFSGTGVVKVTITDNDYCTPTELTLEVVTAYNTTTYSELKNRNTVLLDNITMSSGDSYYLSGATLYGNGFTFDISEGTYAAGGNTSSNYVVCINNAHLDNVEITGAVYTEYGAQVQNAYNRAAVLSTGNSTIRNSFVSNCASAVRIKDGNLEIVNTTVKGGNFANIDIRNGHVVLENVTTINQSNGNDKAADGTDVVGLGVVIYYEQVLDTTTVEIKGTLTQYNYISDHDTFSSTYAQQLVKVMLGSNYTDLQLEKDGVTWANAGIISMTAGMSDNIFDNRTDKGSYIGKDVSFSGVTGYVYTAVPTEETVTAASPTYETAGQGEIAPSYSFDYTTKNYVAKTDGSNDYCYEDGGTVMIAMDEGESFTWDTSILTATKNGQTLAYTVSMDGTDYTGKTITFNTSGTYSVDYTYTDNNNYTLDANGNISTYSKTYTKTVHINVSVIAPEAQNATFTFGSSSTTSTQVTISNNTYVMPDVSATSDTVGGITVSGTTVYYPIVDAYTSDGATAHSSLNSWYMCYPVFKNVVTITDYADAGTGSAVTYDSSTTTMPSGLSLTAYSQYFSQTTAPSGAVSFTAGGADTAFKYQASASASSTPTTLSNVLIYASPTLSNNARDEMYLLVQYKYQDNAGAIYYYYVGYHMPQTTVKSVCVTGDTLVTLADGSQKRVDAVTYEDQLLVWNFFTGQYDVAPAAILFYHGDDLYEVLKLTFDDGTIVKVVNNHGFYHVDTNNFVIIDKDNVETYIGSEFVKSTADGYETVKLTDYELIEEQTGSYSIQTAQHNNFFVEGMFSITMPEYEGWFDYFEIGDNMKYDEAKMQADIEKYGLYTYEDFAEYVTYEQFIAFNGPYLKVLVGRGVVTHEQILDLIEVYVNPQQ